jgi:hypothetical protein
MLAKAKARLHRNGERHGFHRGGAEGAEGAEEDAASPE